MVMVMQSRGFLQDLHSHGLEKGKNVRLAITVSVLIASALLLYSFSGLRGAEHDPASFLSHYAGQLHVVGSGHPPYAGMETPHTEFWSRSHGPPVQKPIKEAANEHVPGLLNDGFLHSQGIEPLESPHSPELRSPPRKQDHGKCERKFIYIYELPQEFNEDLVDKCGRVTDDWIPMCGNLRNNGYGPRILPKTRALNDTNLLDGLLDLEPPHAWFRTEQFSLELIFHERLRKGYPCLTQDPELASAFYIPYYAALDTAFTLFDPNLSARDRLAQRLVGWLTGNTVWARFQGNGKHFLALGRIAWDFSRDKAVAEGWGSALLSQNELSNVTKLLIEKRPWVSNEIAIPYPTSFHPSSLHDVELWQKKLRGRMFERRPLLSSFVGSLSRGTEWSKPLRAELAKQCEQVGADMCRQYKCGDGNSGTLDCVRKPEHISSLFLSSTFCLQPPGDSPTRKGIFDSLLAGCIPVLFINSSAYTQYTWYLPRDGSLYSVLFDGEEVIHGHADIFSTLAHISEDKQRLHRMQAEIIRMLPRLVYSLSGDHSTGLTFKDAFDVAIDNFLEGSPIATS